MPQIVGRKAPEFALEGVLNGNFSTYRLADYRGKWVVLFFYPLDFTFVCPTEILAFSDRLGEFRKLGAEVLGASVDSKFSHLAWTEKPREEGGIKGLAYPLLEDLGKDLARDYGVLAPDGHVALRGLFPDRSGGRRPARHDQQPRGRALRGRVPSRSPGVPVRPRARRGLPRRLEARDQDDEGGLEGLEGVLREGEVKSAS